ncbi:MAG: oligosaccharide flippase family protein [Actinomycetota bacterium]
MVAKGGAVQLLGQFTQKGLTFVFVAIAVRFLGNADYGLYRQVFQILMIATTLAAGGFPAAAVRFIAQARAANDPEVARGAARVALAGAAIASSLVFLVVFVYADELAAVFADSASATNYLAFLLRVGAAFIPLYGCMQVMRFCTQAYKTMTPSVMVGNVIQPATRYGLTLIALIVGLAVAGAVAALVVSAAIALIASLWYYRRLLSTDERKATPRADVGAMLRFAFPQAGVSLFSTQSLGLGVLLVGAFRGDEQVGLYGIAQSLQLAGGLFLGSIVGIWAPVVVDLYHRGDLLRLQSLYQTINRWVATFSVPIFVAMMIQPEFFTRLIGGQGAADAAVLVLILAAGNLFFVATGPSSHLLSMTGRPGINLINSLTSVGLYAGLGIWLVPIYGVIGMAVVDAIVTILLNIARVVEGKIIVGIQPFGRTFYKPLAATLVGGGVLVLLRLILGTSMSMALTSLVVAGVVYLGFLKLLGLDPEEREVIEAIKTRFASILGRRKRPPR